MKALPPTDTNIVKQWLLRMIEMQHAASLPFRATAFSSFLRMATKDAVFGAANIDDFARAFCDSFQQSGLDANGRKALSALVGALRFLPPKKETIERIASFLGHFRDPGLAAVIEELNGVSIGGARTLAAADPGSDYFSEQKTNVWRRASVSAAGSARRTDILFTAFFSEAAGVVLARRCKSSAREILRRLLRRSIKSAGPSSPTQMVVLRHIIFCLMSYLDADLSVPNFMR